MHDSRFNKKISRNNNINSNFLRSSMNDYVQCQYCGRTLIFSDLYKHLRLFHDYEKNLIIDF